MENNWHVFLRKKCKQTRFLRICLQSEMTPKWGHFLWGIVWNFNSFSLVRSILQIYFLI